MLWEKLWGHTEDWGGAWPTPLLQTQSLLVLSHLIILVLATNCLALKTKWCGSIAMTHLRVSHNPEVGPHPPAAHLL